MRSGSVLLVMAIATQSGAQATAIRTIPLSAPDATLTSEFTSLTSVRELADGRVLVVDFGESKLLVADWTRGNAVQVGRNGGGPAEYRTPGTLLPLGGDSTLVPDVQNGRWLLLHGGSIASFTSADAPAIRSGARRPLGADFNGTVIFTQSIAGGSSAEPRRDSVILVRIARSTGMGDTIAKLKARPATIRVSGPASQPTSVSIATNPLAGGETAALFSDRWIAIARLDPYSVDWIAPDGKRVRASPLPFERVRIDQREKAAFVERQAARSGRAARDPDSFPPWPEIIPPFLAEALLTAPDGRLWIRRAPTADNPFPPYDVIDRSGALVARVEAGNDVQVIGFGRTSVFTVATDDNGIQTLQRRPFPRFQKLTGP